MGVYAVEFVVAVAVVAVIIKPVVDALLMIFLPGVSFGFT